MGCVVPPVVQVVKMSDLRVVDSWEGKRESEPLEIGLNGLERWILLAELQGRRELSLNGGSKGNGNGGRANLGAFRVDARQNPWKWALSSMT